MKSETRIRRNEVAAARKWALFNDTAAKHYLKRRRPQHSPDESAGIILAAEVERLEKMLEESNCQARKDVAALALALDRRGQGIP